MASGAIAAHPPLLTLSSSFPNSMFSSPTLSLALTNIDGLGAGETIPPDDCGGFETNARKTRRRRSREEEPGESRSGSEGSGDDLDATAGDNPRKKKRYHRHTPQQIQELEAMFKECPHPDEKQRLELSRRLCLETKQVKFWFQNRRTQMKTQLERHENTLLRQENEKLRTENLAIREAMIRNNPIICTNCGGVGLIEEQQLRIENARLKDELDRVCALAGKFIGRPPAEEEEEEYEGGGMMVMERNRVYLEMGLAAMDELLKMGNNGGEEPLWIGQRLNEEEYLRMFNGGGGGGAGGTLGINPNSFVSEASTQTALLLLNTSALLDALMDSVSQLSPSLNPTFC